MINREFGENREVISWTALQWLTDKDGASRLLPG